MFSPMILGVPRKFIVQKLYNNIYVIILLYNNKQLKIILM